MITLAIDTSDMRGSVAILKEGAVPATETPDCPSEFSAWLLPAVRAALSKAQVKMEQLDLLAVCTGPGSFTGLRVGLTTMKAWAEVYNKPIVGVSRLEAIARSCELDSGLLAACYDAQRGQIFAGLYRQCSGSLQRLGKELVIGPEDFVHMVDDQFGEKCVSWVSLNPELMADLKEMKVRVAAGDRIIPAPSQLAPIIGKMAEQMAAAGQLSDPISLDANYVRRSDAEIFWKGSPGIAR